MAGPEVMRPSDGRPSLRVKPALVLGPILMATLVIVVARFTGPLHTLQPHYTDHVRHEYAAWASLQIGSRIWSEPMSDWDASARFPHETWLAMPHPHPPGSLLLFLPFGAAANLGVVPDEGVHVLLIVFLGGAGIAAVAALWLTLRPSYPVPLALVITVLGGVELIRWGLNGFLDPAAVLVALVGIGLLQRGRSGTAVLVLAVALSMHYRLWYLLPVAAGAAFTRGKFDSRAAMASGIVLASALPLLVLWPYLGELPISAGFYPNILYGEVFVALIAAGVILLVAVTERRATSVLATAAAAMMILFNPQWQPWYSVAFLPLLPMVRRAPAQAALTVGWIQMALLSPQALEIPSLLTWLGDAVT